MTQDERWLARYNEVMSFMEENHRNPSRHRIEEHDMLNWLKANRKALNAGKMKEERVAIGRCGGLYGLRRLTAIVAITGGWVMTAGVVGNRESSVGIIRASIDLKSAICFSLLSFFKNTSYEN